MEVKIGHSMFFMLGQTGRTLKPFLGWHRNEECWADCIGTDGCDCAWSFSGCTPFIAYLKGFQYFGVRERDYFVGSERNDFIRFDRRFLTTAVQSIVGDSKSPVTKGQQNQILLFITSHLLRMTHTCCNLAKTRVFFEPRRSLDLSNKQITPLSREQRRAIREEEKFLIDVLDEVVLQFKSDYDKFAGTLNAFMSSM